MSINVAQLQYESDQWKRLIEFVRLENAHCKNRLSEIIKTSAVPDVTFLEVAEYYQDYFIKQDILVDILRSDVFDFDKLLEKELYLDGSLAKVVAGDRKKLQVEIEKLSIAYNTGFKQFNSFLESNS